MPTKPVANLVVRTKNINENVGSVMEKDDGSQFLLIKPWMNFAGMKAVEPVKNHYPDYVVVSIIPIHAEHGEH